MKLNNDKHIFHRHKNHLPNLLMIIRKVVLKFAVMPKISGAQVNLCLTLAYNRDSIYSTYYISISSMQNIWECATKEALTVKHIRNGKRAPKFDNE